jgi:hypothetical protein
MALMFLSQIPWQIACSIWLIWPSSCSHVTFMMDGSAAGTGAELGWMDDEDRWMLIRKKSTDENQQSCVVDQYIQTNND